MFISRISGNGIPMEIFRIFITITFLLIYVIFSLCEFVTDCNIIIFYFSNISIYEVPHFNSNAPKTHDAGVA